MGKLLWRRLEIGWVVVLLLGGTCLQNSIATLVPDCGGNERKHLPKERSAAMAGLALSCRASIRSAIGHFDQYRTESVSSVWIADASISNSLGRECFSYLFVASEIGFRRVGRLSGHVRMGGS
jgi:hypothetical protein